MALFRARNLGRIAERYVDLVRSKVPKFKDTSDAMESGNRLLNKLTGYDQCERLRDSVALADKQFQSLKEQLQASRVAFTKAIAERSLCQKELNGLLQRKPSWLDADLQRFTELYRAEMRLESAEASAKEANEYLEQLVDQAHHNLVGAMRERYQEEQLWSDKIRRASTFGTFGLMALNFALFAALQTSVEPRKRRAFIQQFETIVAEQLAKTKDTGPTVVLRPVDQRVSMAKQLLAGGAALVALNCLILFNFK